MNERMNFAYSCAKWIYGIFISLYFIDKQNHHPVFLKEEAFIC